MPMNKASQTHCSRSARLARKASEICLRASEKTADESLTGLLDSVHKNTNNKRNALFLKFQVLHL